MRGRISLGKGTFLEDAITDDIESATRDHAFTPNKNPKEGKV